MKDLLDDIHRLLKKIGDHPRDALLAEDLTEALHTFFREIDAVGFFDSAHEAESENGLLTSLSDLSGEILRTASVAREALLNERFNQDEQITVLNALDRIGRDLRSRIAAAGKKPFSEAMNRMAPIVRLIARMTGKSICFRTQGGQIAVEQNVLDILEPLMETLVRHAAEHSIESVEFRSAVGKDETGLIDLTVRCHPGSLFIEIAADGRGHGADEHGDKSWERTGDSILRLCAAMTVKTESRVGTVVHIHIPLDEFPRRKKAARTHAEADRRSGGVHV